MSWPLSSENRLRLGVCQLHWGLPACCLSALNEPCCVFDLKEADNVKSGQMWINNSTSCGRPRQGQTGVGVTLHIRCTQK
jgi:hypothetical protein